MLDLIFRNEREIGGMESAHDSFIWNLSWHPLGHILVSCSSDHTSKFWCRNRPGEEMRDKYNTASALITEDTGEGTKIYNILPCKKVISQILKMSQTITYL